jgi:hypothetical protein
MAARVRTLLRAGPVSSGCAHPGLAPGAPASSLTTGFAGGAAARSAVAALAVLLALVAAGCGADYPDVFLLTRSGSLPGARLTLLVNDGGTVSCNGREAVQLPPRLLLDARGIARDLAEEAHEDLTLPAPRRSLLRYRLRTEEGTVTFSDVDAARRPELAPVIVFARSVARDVCGLAR